MGSHILEILRQGLWASLTGGWFYDPHQSVFCNTFHLYLWLFLLCFPFTLYLTLPGDLLIWMVYSLVILLAFISLKLVNHQLHHMYDTSEVIEEDSSESSENGDEKVEDASASKTSDTGLSRTQMQGEATDGIELAVISSSSQRASITPPVHCSSRNSMVDSSSRSSGRHNMMTPADSMEYINRLVREGVRLSRRGSAHDLKVDVHRRDSLGGIEPCSRVFVDKQECTVPGSLDLFTSENRIIKLSTAITPRATPGTNRKFSVTASDTNTCTPKPSKESLNAKSELHDSGSSSTVGTCHGTDPGDSPSWTRRPRWHRKAVRRSKSTLESHVDSKLARLDPREPQEHKVGRDWSRGMSLPESSRLRLPLPMSSLTVQSSLPVCCRPSHPHHSKKSLDPDTSSLSSYKETSPECEVSPDQTKSMPHLRNNGDFVQDSEYHHPSRGHSYHRSLDSHYRTSQTCKSTTSSLVSRSPSDPLPKSTGSSRVGQRLAMGSPSLDEVQSSPPHTEKDSEVFLGDVHSENDHVVAGTHQQILPETISDTYSSQDMDNHTCEAKVEDSKTIPSNKRLIFKLPREKREEPVAVDLNWLFSTDTDSSLSGHHHMNESTQDSSTMTHDDTSGDGESLDMSSGPVLYPPQFPPPISSSSTSTSPSITSPEADSELLPSQHQQLGQGARPKQRPVTVRSSDGEDSCDESSNGKPQVAHSVELSKRLLEILNNSNPAEAEEELRKFKEELFSQIDFDTPDRWQRRVGRRGRRLVRARRRLPSVSSQSPEESPPGQGKQADAEQGGGSSRESSASTHNESSALLPEKRTIPNDTQTIGDKENVPDLKKRRRHSSRGSKRSGSMLSDGPPTEALESLAAAQLKHLAQTHNDTTEGAIHCFQDEYGNWLTYTFGESSAGIATGIIDAVPGEKQPPDKCLSETPRDQENTSRNMMYLECSTESLDSTVILETEGATATTPPIPSPAEPNPEALLRDLSMWGNSSGRNHRNVIQQYVETLLESGQHQPLSMGDTSDSDTTQNATGSEDKPKHYYKFFMVPCHFMKIRFDRLALLALLDRNTLMENLISVLLAVWVGVLGALLLTHEFYRDFWIFVLCFIMAGCQYSLLKSVQPDAASPMHGYNRIIVFSRPFYFCVCASLILVLHYSANSWESLTFDLYGMPFTTKTALIFGRDLVKVFLLCLPLIFTVGLLPQVNTFLIYTIEQIEMHVFGGHATSSLSSAVFTVCRSCFAVAILYGLCYLGIKEPIRGDGANTSQHVLFSIYVGLLVPISYHLSRSSSDPTVLWEMIRHALLPSKYSNKSDRNDELIDPLPAKLRKTVFERMRSDLIVCCVSAVLVFAVSVSTAFTSPVLQPTLFDVLVYVSGSLGLVIHYIIPQLRKEMPWLCCSQPVLPSHERAQFEVRDAARVMWFEKLYMWLRFFERNFLYPAVFLSAVTTSARQIIEADKFGVYLATFIVVLCSLKMFRCGFGDTQNQFIIVSFTTFFFKYDFGASSETFIVDYFFMSLLFVKFYDLTLKMKFILTYIAPWQITWGSAFHAFAQPFSVPPMLFAQAIVSAFFSAPLNPLLGSAIFLTAYVRPVKFWERDYNTKRVDHTNTRLSSQLERNPGADDNNLNSIFYEHLTRSLQHSLCGDLLMGRWGNVGQGDCFIMASDYLNALVHIVETGNGLVTFQLRGLEFRGTYCQQREVEAITEGVEEDEGFCCCHPGHLPHFLSLNAAFNQRWLAWEVVVIKYVLEGYSISDNSAATMLQVFDLRRVLITYYVKSIIYYTVRSPKLYQWLADENIREGVCPMMDKDYVDLDPTFNLHVDDDYDYRVSGISKTSFCNHYHEWIQYCATRRDKTLESGKESWLLSLCFGLALLGRRALGTASHNNASASVDFFLYGLHALFKGDFRITCARDEWVFNDMEMLRRVVAPGVRMSLKLHQDHFTSPDEYDDNNALYTAITSHEENMVISHEADPAWRNAVLSNTPSLLALRHVLDEGSDEYKVIMLNKRYLSFRVIKVNRECVRGLWAGQLQELIYLRNRNPERGSIQNVKQALRNMINSSCDQPIGYPIYVSPLTTSYSSTNEQYCSVVGKEFSLKGVFSALRHLWARMRERCGASCTSGSMMGEDGHCGGVHASPYSHSATIGRPATAAHTPTSQLDPLHPGVTNRGSVVSTTSSASKPSAAFINITGFMAPDSTPKETLGQRVQLMDTSQVFDNINLGRRIDVQWPNEEWRQKGGKNQWGGWVPERGMEGLVVHRWLPCHRDIGRRSHVDRIILLIKIVDRYVPIAEAGVLDLGIEV